MSYREQRFKIARENAGIKWSDDQIRTAGIDKRKLKKLYRLLEEAGKIMEEQKLELYGASGNCSIVHISRPTHDEKGCADYGSEVMSVGYGWWNGGDW